VSPRKQSPQSKLERLRALPWIAILQVGVAVSRRWRGLSAKERARLAQLARASRGRPRNLSVKERLEAGRLIGKLDLKGLGREAFPLLRGGGRGRRRRRRGA